MAPGRRLRLWTTADGFHLHYGPAGSYDIRLARGTIEWFPAPTVELELARSLLLGQVMALVLRHSRALCLHGSAVAIEDRGIVFLAPKLRGKSTLAMALSAAGARLVADDLAVIDPTGPALLPGVHSVRLFDDSAERLTRGLDGTIVPGGKQTVTQLGRSMVQTDTVPLCAVYLLESVTPQNATPACRRNRVAPLEAAVRLAQGTKVSDELIGYEAAGDDLSVAASIVQTVPVYRLEVVWDFDRLDDVVQRILAWEAPAEEPLLRASGG